MTRPLASSKRAAPVARLRDAQATQQAILAAARRHFARSGYEGAYLKEIAADAGVDAALINRYFGGKDGLFEAAIEGALHTEYLVKGKREEFGRHAAASFAGKGRDYGDEAFECFALILHAVTSKNGARLLNKAVRGQFIGPIKEWLGGEDSGARARLFTALIVGLLVERMVRAEAVPAEEEAAFKARLTNMLQTLVDG